MKYMYITYIHIHIYTWTHHIFFIHSSVDGYLVCFHVLSTVNSAAMNIGVHESFWIRVFSRYMARNGTAGSWACMLSHFSCVWLFVTPWTVARQAPLSMEFSRQEYWSGLPCPPSFRGSSEPRDLTMSLMSPALAAGLFTSSVTWETLAGSHGSSIFNFLWKVSLFSVVSAPIYIPSNSVGGFPFWKALWMWSDWTEEAVGSRFPSTW